MRTRAPWVMVLAVGGSALMAACSSSASTAGNGARASSTTTGPPPHELRVEAADFKFTLPATVPSGVTDVVLHNQGDETHQLDIVRMAPGKTKADLLGAVAKLDPTGVATLLGGPNEVAPGKRGRVTIDLRPGNYFAICLIPGADGVPHILKGMMTPFTVTGSAEPRALPTADRTVSLREFAFAGLETFDGTGTMLIKNDGTLLHELDVERLNDGKTVTDLVRWSNSPVFAPAPPQPSTAFGGTTLLSPGQSVFIDFGSARPSAGHYVALCFFPAFDNRSHAAHGMTYDFTVP